MLICEVVDVPAHVLGDVLNDFAVHTDVPGHVQADVPPTQPNQDEDKDKGGFGISLSYY